MSSPEAEALAVTQLKGAGPAVARRLEKLGIRTVQDLLFHLPLRYQDRTRVVPIGTLRPGDEAVVEGEVLLTEIKYGRRRMLLSRISDGTGSLTLRFFHFNAAQQAGLARGTRVRCFGEIRPGPVTLEIVHPEYQRVDDTAAAGPKEDHLTPIYPATEGLQQPTLRKLVGQALDRVLSGEGNLSDWLPHSLALRLNLPPLLDSVCYLHRPPPEAPRGLLEDGAHPARRRLAFEELLAHNLSLRRIRRQIQQEKAPALAPGGHLPIAFRAALPFSLTAAQERVIAEIAADLAREVPMLRLVQGDVGSGKTVVGAMAALFAVEAGYQAAIMAPTELLAEQHQHTFRRWLQPLGLTVEWLSGRLKGKTREQALQRIGSGEAHLVVGTHALFQEGVDFQELGLVVIDEQHRFGVHQRLALREKGSRDGRRPHQLIMTATPIPRTLAMTAYADLDCSIIDELPPGRTAVETVAIPDGRREEIVARLRHAVGDGRQAYWVCTLIEGSDTLQAQAAEETARLLQQAVPELRIGLVHGRMKADARERIMNAFKDGDLDLLVATTVIEVGVDVPNASLMIIENAERLGLAQLHQLRGRVGRGRIKSNCILMYRTPLSHSARERLDVLRKTNDGFEVARKDLELRGPGEVLGTKQKGLLPFRIADLQRDRSLLPAVAQTADELLEHAPEHVDPLIRRWVGDAERYGMV